MKYGLTWDKEKNPETIVEQTDNAVPYIKDIKELTVKGTKESHILIDSDNYPALKILNQTHRNKVDIICIDPPYNTGGGEFIYNDKRIDDEDSYKHSKWLNFMEKRLRLSYDLLKEDGVAYCFIGDDEVANLTLMMDQIFGEDNRVNIMSRITSKGSARDKHMENSCDYILVYSKNGSANFGVKREDLDAKYSLLLSGLYGKTANQRYWVECPDGSLIIPKGNKYPKAIINNNIKGELGDRNWYYAKEKFNVELQKGNIIFKRLSKASTELLDENFNGSYWRVDLKTKKKSNIQRIPNFLIEDKFTNKEGTKELLNLFDNDKSLVLMKPKPTALIKHLIEITNKSKDITILDFFGGSGTTAHAVMAMNEEDLGSRQSITIALNDTDDDKNICTEITYERLKKVVNIIKEKYNGQLDLTAAGNPTLKYLKVELKEDKGTTHKELIKEHNKETLCQ